MVRNILSFAAISLAAFVLSSCGGGGGGGGSSTPAPTPPASFTIGGTVSGLSSGSVTVFNNGGNSFVVSTNGPFTMPGNVQAGSAYSISIAVNAPGQSCSVNNRTGTVTASNVTNIAIVCGTSRTVGGTVTGLSGTVVLLLNGGNNLSVSANGGFTFTSSVPDNTSFTVAVSTQPAGQSCTVSNGTGAVAGSNVTNVQVSCTAAPTTFSIGGSVSGLNGTVVLQNNGGNNLSVTANGAFTFTNAQNNNTPYAVTVLTQPAGQTCTVSSGAGTVNGANVSNVSVSCVTAPTFTIGGSISGLVGTVTLQNNGGNNLTTSANGAFTFTTAVNSGGAYNVTVLTQPTGMACTVTSGTGNASANVTNVGVACVNSVQSCPAVAGAATLTLGAGSTFHSFVLKTPSNANNVNYSSYAFDFSLQSTSSSAASVNVTDGAKPTVSIADLGAVCGLGGITAFPAKGQFITSVGTQSLQVGHGYFVEAPNGSYARLYISKVANGAVDIQYEYPSVICPASGVTMTYDIGIGGIKQTYNGVSVTGLISSGGTQSNNGLVGSANSTPFFGCIANATVQAWGAGGGGGGNFDLVGGAGGGGGGGGGYGTQSLTLTQGQYYLVAVGLGGTGAGVVNASGKLDGVNGGSSSFSTFSASDTNITGTSVFVSAGGQGGKAPTSHTANSIGGTGGAGITASGLSGTNGVPTATTVCTPGVTFGIGPGGAGGNAGGSGGAGGTATNCTPGTPGIPGGGGAGRSQNGGATDGANGRISISY